MSWHIQSIDGIILAQWTKDFFPGIGRDVQTMKQKQIFSPAAGEVGQLSLFELNE
jgi:hypothetical protein